MAYFRRNDGIEVTGNNDEQDAGYVRLFNRDDTEQDADVYDDGFDELSGDSAEDGDVLTEEEEEELRRDRYRLAAGLGNLAAIVVGCVIILVMIALLFSLINWLQNDVSHTFTLWNSRL
ncbi:MAG: hypothetical protein MJ142_01550 [Clostridia bacterium]|nr:hypothetical protein [Clostridia bacterium]